MTVGMADAFGAERLDRAAAIRPDEAVLREVGRGEKAGLVRT